MQYSYGEEINYYITKLNSDNVDLVQSFTCGNELIDHYLKNEAYRDEKAVTYLYLEESSNLMLGFASISCSGILCQHEKTCITRPSISINYFAINTEIQHLPYDREQGEDRYCISDQMFCDLLSMCRMISNEYIGAEHVTLYSVPKAYSFYRRNMMSEFTEYMTRENYPYIEGCIPMFMAL